MKQSLCNAIFSEKHLFLNRFSPPLDNYPRFSTGNSQLSMHCYGRSLQLLTNSDCSSLLCAMYGTDRRCFYHRYQSEHVTCNIDSLVLIKITSHFIISYGIKGSLVFSCVYSPAKDGTEAEKYVLFNIVCGRGLSSSEIAV